VLVVTIGIDLRTTIAQSVWDPAVSVVRWFALGYGVYLVYRLLPGYVAHGRTRHEFLGAGLYRSGGSELVVIALGLAMVVVTGDAIGFNGLPFVGAVVDVADLPLARTLALCLAGLLPGAAATWALVRDIPIRTRAA
jgi:hypothetical protein